jgi:hypothetical protein
MSVPVFKYSLPTRFQSLSDILSYQATNDGDIRCPSYCDGYKSVRQMNPHNPLPRITVNVRNQTNLVFKRPFESGSRMVTGKICPVFEMFIGVDCFIHKLDQFQDCCKTGYYGFYGYGKNRTFWFSLY